MQDPLETYCRKLIKEKGEPETAKSRSDLLKIVNDAIDRALLGALPEEQFSKLEVAVKENNVNDDLIEQLLSEAGVDSEKVIKETLDSFRNEFLKGDK